MIVVELTKLQKLIVRGENYGLFDDQVVQTISFLDKKCSLAEFPIAQKQVVSCLDFSLTNLFAGTANSKINANLADVLSADKIAQRLNHMITIELESLLHCHRKIVCTNEPSHILHLLL